MAARRSDRMKGAQPCIVTFKSSVDAKLGAVGQCLQSTSDETEKTWDKVERETTSRYERGRVASSAQNVISSFARDAVALSHWTTGSSQHHCSRQATSA